MELGIDATSPDAGPTLCPLHVGTGELAAPSEATGLADPSGATWGPGGSHTLDTQAVPMESVLSILLTPET